jgi:hypothetical protein
LHARSALLQRGAIAVSGNANTLPWYKSTTIVAGIVLVLLGGGNWITGTIRLREHEAVATTPLPTPQADARPSARRKGASEEEVEIARGRMDFYHVVASGGRLMTAAGFVLLTFALARHLRPQAKRR